MFSACTSIKVAVLLNKITDLPKEHSVLSTPSFTIGSFLRLPCCCGRDLFSLPVGPGNIISNKLMLFWTSLVAQTVKCLPTMWENWVQSLGWEDLLEKEMATHSSILA